MTDHTVSAPLFLSYWHIKPYLPDKISLASLKEKLFLFSLRLVYKGLHKVTV